MSLAAYVYSLFSIHSVSARLGRQQQQQQNKNKYKNEINIHTVYGLAVVAAAAPAAKNAFTRQPSAGACT